MNNGKQYVSPQEALKLLEFCITNRINVMQVGRPGIGKTELPIQVAKKLNARMLIWHPIIMDPTDLKGFPMIVDGVAKFVPFDELVQLMTADKLTICLLDDLGQANNSVQAASMQPIWARQIGGKKISDSVRFVTATNRAQDMAGVSTILEPLKSRQLIINLEATANDWVIWALDHGMPMRLIAFIKYAPEFIEEWEPSRDIANKSNPRLVAEVGKAINKKPDKSIERWVYEGLCGQEFALRFTAFSNMYNKLPNIDKIIHDPNSVDVPAELDVLYAVTSALLGKLKKTNGAISPEAVFNSSMKFLSKAGKREFDTFFVTSAVQLNDDLTETEAYVRWATNGS